MVAQLPLNIQLRDDATFASYYPGDNKEALIAVTEMARGVGESFMYLWGPLGSGRTHLLQAACHLANEQGLGALYIPLGSAFKTSLDLLQDIEVLPLICLDDVESIANRPEWEEALFHLFNRIRAQNSHLLIAADIPPMQLKIQLADLKSRLTWGVVYQLHTLNDEQKLLALQLRAHHRGLQLDTLVGRYLLNHCPRDMGELFQLLEQLDRASLTEQRRLTIPFVKYVLGM